MTRTRIDHTAHDHANSKVARAICRRELMAGDQVVAVATKAIAAEDTKPTKVKVYNMSNGNVEVHAPGCADPRKKDPLADGGRGITYPSIHAIWEDYNADFIQERDDMIAEGETDTEGHTHTLHVYKCTGMTDRKVAYNA